jgi:hypothetical protein
MDACLYVGPDERARLERLIADAEVAVHRLERLGTQVAVIRRRAARAREDFADLPHRQRPALVLEDPDFRGKALADAARLLQPTRGR